MTDYIELHTHSYFSLLDGASPPEDLVTRAAELGMPALGLTDHDAVYGAVRFTRAAEAQGVRPILGAELTLHDDSHLTLLVRDAQGWANLCTLISAARHHAPKGQARLPKDLLAQHASGLIALTGCRRGALPALLGKRAHAQARAHVRDLQTWFGGAHVFVELQHHLLPGDDLLNWRLAALAETTGAGLVATNNAHYARREGARLQQVLTAIRLNRTLEEAAPHLYRNSEYFLKSAGEMASAFRGFPDALANTRRIADACTFALEFGLQNLPVYPVPADQTTDTYLARLCEQGLKRRGIPLTESVCQQLAHELAVIARSGLSNYFLIVWDIVRYAGERGIACQGRGSAANSLVAYALGISPVNPIAHNLVFERFLSDERQAVPDIDIDFDAARREEIIQYVYERYGRDHAAMACTLVTFRGRSAVRDVGKALGLPTELLERIASSLDTFSSGQLAESPALQEALGGRDQGEVWRLLTELCGQIDKFPRHLGIHNGGMVVTGPRLSQRVPTEPATMADRSVVQWDKDSLEDAGIAKIDILGLRMLSAISDAARSALPDPAMLDALHFDDPAVFAMITKADTIGVFQVESRAQQQVLPRLQPRTFNDLIVSISLIRPGPVQGQMVHPYLRRRAGTEAVTYLHPSLQPALEETLGVVLFQEQILKIARDFAGFTPGRGEQLRRALGSKHAADAVGQFQADFVAGAQAKGASRAIADMVFDVLRAFGGYSFPKSHAAAFAVLVYQSAWLKCYYPAHFYVALLNNQPMGFWSPAVICNDARHHSIEVLGVEINQSSAKCTVQDGAVRLGLNYVKGFGEAMCEMVVEARGGVPFTSLDDFCRRARLPRMLVENLIVAGAFDTWGVPRRELIWQLGQIDSRDGLMPLRFPETPAALPHASVMETIESEWTMMGLSLREHPMALQREDLTARGIVSSTGLESLREGTMVTTAGMLLIHQAPPTAKGFHFVTLEDEFGFVNVIVRPDIYVRYRRVLRGALFLEVQGELQREGSVVNLLARAARRV
jgi:error-prone DNA polymerase